MEALALSFDSHAFRIGASRKHCDFSKTRLFFLDFWFIFLCLFLVLMDLLGVACGRLRSFAIFGLYGMFGVHGTSGGFFVFGVAWGCRGCVRFLGLSLVSWASLGGLGLLRLDL